MTDTLTPELEIAITVGFENRDRNNMAPTIEYFHRLLEQHPENPAVLYEVGGSYDTDGQEETAAGYYEQALAKGLSGDIRRRCLLQYGSTLRNLGRHHESLATFAQGRAELPDSDSMRIFEALSFHAAGRFDEGFGELLLLIAERLDSAEVVRYAVAIEGNGRHLIDRAESGTPMIVR
ncbi:tetratricopeptide repeat protein [Plantibacter sp. VKM Ac-2880]|uniref:tetratricopeptide repeat protein n=1 Tax=Plantibacter sp. VKM Ac-2880 TaxID=2783827 RepID=UPI00188DE65C|nr:tetratricopeptide repeat protein [Plantibacter sp. VKM Ac-2880]MBF4570091.1 tetratricopeptide repeat protein [Plantibacter sp. VKM Ac-2880]